MASTAVNNQVYRELGHAWWDDDVGEFSTLRFFINPVRLGFFLRILQGRALNTVLDVGCGGGILAEDLARAGYRVTGIDPAPESIETAKNHAAVSGLDIEYRVGSGEQLPFANDAFDVVACCDVLEHVDDVDRVIAEVARILRPGGVFLFDTINRTWVSRLAVIKVMQEWSATAFAAPNSHVWEKFIKPDELSHLLGQRGLSQRELRGLSTHHNVASILLDFRRRAKGQISFRELGRRLAFHESDDLEVSYMGYAVKGPAV